MTDVRPRAKDAEREQARQLRLEGLTYGEIASRLGVSKSSISLWTRDLPHPAPTQKGQEARHAGAKRYFDLRRRRVFIERQNEKLAWCNSIGELSDRELQIAGAVAYWAEGTKAKPWRPQERVVFTNSDPAMMRFFLVFLERLGVASDSLRFRVYIHESAEIDATTQSWSDAVGVSIERFDKPVVKRHIVPTNRKNTGVDYRGTLTVSVLGSATLYRRIEGIWWAVRQAAAVSHPGVPVRLDDRSTADDRLSPVGLHPRLALFRSILRCSRNCGSLSGTD